MRSVCRCAGTGSHRHAYLTDAVSLLATQLLVTESRSLSAVTASLFSLVHTRGTDAELCVSSPRFTLHRRRFVQTFNFVQITWHCLHNIAGAVSDHSSHRERRCTGVVSVRWMSQHYTKIIKLKYCEKKNTIVLYSSRLNWGKNIFHSCLESRCMHWLLIFIYLILLYLKNIIQ